MGDRRAPTPWDGSPKPAPPPEPPPKRDIEVSPMHGLVKQWKHDYELMKAERDTLKAALENIRERHKPHGERKRCYTCGLDGGTCSDYSTASAALAACRPPQETAK